MSELLYYALTAVGTCFSTILALGIAAAYFTSPKRRPIIYKFLESGIINDGRIIDETDTCLKIRDSKPSSYDDNDLSRGKKRPIYTEVWIEKTKIERIRG